VTSEYGVNASCGPHDGNVEDGTAPAPGTETPPSRQGPVGYFKLRSQLFRRRDRWGKVHQEMMCHVCGRALWVNWTRARPCLFCDDSVRAARAVSRDMNDGRGGEA
jgi:hypothetical protein